MKEATERQREILNFIAIYSVENNFPPTIREIASHFSLSIKGAYDHISALKKKGYLKYKSRQSRTMEVSEFERTKAKKELIAVPVLGVIAAGQPCFAEENYDGFITIHASMLKKSRDYFALKVRGDSMTDAGILEGDTAIVEKQSDIQNGEIAVIQLEGKITLKRFFREGDTIKLQSENPQYKPIYCNGSVTILGRLTCVMRMY